MIVKRTKSCLNWVVFAHDVLSNSLEARVTISSYKNSYLYIYMGNTMFTNVIIVYHIVNVLPFCINLGF